MKTLARLFYSSYIVLFIFFLFLWWLIAYAEEQGLLTKEFFDGNLLPELIGFSLEGMFFVGVLAVYNRVKERARVRSVHYRLLDTISLFPKRVSFQIKDQGLFNADDVSGVVRELDNRQGFAYSFVTTALYRLYGDIPSKQDSLTVDVLCGTYLPIIADAEFSKARLDELLSLASTLSIEYLDKYNLLRQILEELSLLKDSFTKDHVQCSAKAFLLVENYNNIAKSFV